MEKLNIAELLKDCPKGMELDCTLFDAPTYFEEVTYSSIQTYLIKIKVEYNEHVSEKFSLDKYGCIYDRQSSKCVIFPKGKTTWEGFAPPCKFKDGDVLISHVGSIFIFDGVVSETNNLHCYVGMSYDGMLEKDIYSSCVDCCRLADEEEKQKLFDNIKANGYKWNAEAKTLAKINKFDITTLKPFDKVLVRDVDTEVWTPNFYGYKCKEFQCVLNYWCQCIPFEGNEHLLGTTNDCDEFYKNW